MTVEFIANDKGNPPGKPGRCARHFDDGPFAGLELIGFSVWERRTGSGRNVTFPARQVQRQRRASQLRAFSANHRGRSAGTDSRLGARGLCLLRASA